MPRRGEFFVLEGGSSDGLPECIARIPVIVRDALLAGFFTGEVTVLSPDTIRVSSSSKRAWEAAQRMTDSFIDEGVSGIFMAKEIGAHLEKTAELHR